MRSVKMKTENYNNQIVSLNEFVMNKMFTKNGQTAKTKDVSPAITMGFQSKSIIETNMKVLDKRLKDQRRWLRELAHDIRALEAGKTEDRFKNYDAMFLKRSFKTCWSLYRAIASDKAHLEKTYKKKVKSAA